ncbi:ABC transporter permease [Allostreptomyces psammosilenae]|uniref:Transport permease protein n=1 Tax=Allostreptomyces psammosilenae TaxID=1892865 RepID=A0A853AA24_9ACTN|nr:ABC transporter permease [Allostreptomyces psammosilenae]NYI07368.1 teichoic acid transport system permease protein [Allostreptomyces psammosilenae]
MTEPSPNGTAGGGGTSAPAGGDESLTPAELAAKYGLSQSGARPTLAEYCRQLWQRRHFIQAYSNAKLLTMYSGARIGQVWQVLTPLLNAAVYYLIFGLLLETDRDIENFPAFLITGVFVFTFTQTAALQGTKAISGNLGLVRALHFPRAALPIAITLSQLQQLLISMVVLCGIVIATGEPLTFNWLLAVPVLLLQSLFNVGLSLIMARLGAQLPDMSQLMPFILRTWMYASGVMYSISVFAQDAPTWVRLGLELNPAAAYIELMREALIDSVNRADSVLSVGLLWGAAAAWALVVGIGGFVYFWKAEERYGRG